MIEFQETCDRCGVVVKHAGSLEYDEAVMKFTVMGNSSYDLCPKCWDAFKVWLGGKNTED